MDNQRTILWALFGGMVFLTWSKWQTDHAPAPGEIPATAIVEESVDDIELPVATAAPADDKAPVVSTTPSTVADETAVDYVADRGVQLVSVSTGLLDVQISTRGGTLVSVKLPKYPVSKSQPDVPVQILIDVPGEEYVIASGLVDANRGGPTHLTVLESAADSYTLDEGQEVLRVPFTWKNDAGVTVEKSYYFYPDRYDIGVEYFVSNDSVDPWRGLSYIQIRKDHKPMERSMFNVDTYSFDGPVIYDGEKYEKIDPEDLEDDPLDLTVSGGWIAAIEHHFLSAAVPPPDESFTYDAKFLQGKVTLRGSGPTLTVEPGETATVTAKLFVGPKLQNQLDDTAEGLALTADYGMLAILAQPLFWLLEQVHKLIGNWGWSIILVTFMIKATFYKLTEASGRSMAKMRKLQPRLKALQERYKDDRQALSQHMMELYKREKVNPAAGCLPMLIQIPFFIAFYWVLLESVEMRQAPFMLWITDLSTRDPYFVLPLLMGIAMFVQQKLNPAPPDPIQAKVMSILPIMFTVFFAFFPAGLVIYWLTNSVLSVLQQWNINRKMGAEG
jgi:YidC/Oxa1 family membrane protein insertase